MRCIFVLDLFWKITAKNVLKSRFFAVTFKTNRKNEQVQGIVDSTLFYNVSSDYTVLIFQFRGQSCLSSRQRICCRRLVIQGATVFDLYQEKMIMMVFGYIITIAIKLMKVHLICGWNNFNVNDFRSLVRYLSSSER